MYIEKRSNRVLTQKQHDKIKQPKTVEARLLGLALAERICECTGDLNRYKAGVLQLPVGRLHSARQQR